MLTVEHEVERSGEVICIIELYQSTGNNNAGEWVFRFKNSRRISLPPYHWDRARKHSPLPLPILLNGFIITHGMG